MSCSQAIRLQWFQSEVERRFATHCPADAEAFARSTAVVEEGLTRLVVFSTLSRAWRRAGRSGASTLWRQQAIAAWLVAGSPSAWAGCWDTPASPAERLLDLARARAIVRDWPAVWQLAASAEREAGRSSESRRLANLARVALAMAGEPLE